MAVTHDPDLHENEQGTRFFFGKAYHWTRPEGRHTPLVLASGPSPYEETHVQSSGLLSGLQTLSPGEQALAAHKSAVTATKVPVAHEMKEKSDGA